MWWYEVWSHGEKVWAFPDPAWFFEPYLPTPEQDVDEWIAKHTEYTDCEKRRVFIQPKGPTMKESLAKLHVAGLEEAVAAGFSWQTLIQLLIQYGPMVLQLIQLILPFVTGQGKKLTVAEALAWVVAAAQAVQAGQPLPALPTP